MNFMQRSIAAIHLFGQPSDKKCGQVRFNGSEMVKVVPCWC
jgi:hypothetical protein